MSSLVFLSQEKLCHWGKEAECGFRNLHDIMKEIFKPVTGHACLVASVDYEVTLSTRHLPFRGQTSHVPSYLCSLLLKLIADINYPCVLFINEWASHILLVYYMYSHQ